MNKLEQAARQAIYKINQATALDEESDELLMEAITALREALAEQSEQEPVGWYSHKGGFNECGEGQPLYASPVRTKDLTDEEIWDLWESNKNETAIEFYEAIIAAYKEKNK